MEGLNKEQANQLCESIKNTFIEGEGRTHNVQVYSSSQHDFKIEVINGWKTVYLDGKIIRDITRAQIIANHILAPALLILETSVNDKSCE
ncbi:hypothetical protein V8U20_001004 [Bacillus cereus]